MKNEKGFALVLTLMVTALMVAVVVELIHQVSVDVSLSRSFRDGQQASLLAESGYSGGVKLLGLALSQNSYTSLTDMWNTPLKLDDETGTVEAVALEESGKININGLVPPNDQIDEQFTQAALRRLGKRLQIPDELWNALADWLDSNDQPLSGGAETPYYKTRRPAYSARNGQLVTLQELLLVKGFTPEIVAKLRPFVTLYTGDPGISRVNVNTAPKEVLTALDDKIDDGIAERIIEERRVRPFKAASELSRVPGLEYKYVELLKCADVKGKVFRVTSLARVRETARTVEAVVRMTGGVPEILSWQEY